MKLLFDENLSPKLPSLLKNEFPGSLHVRDCGLKGKTDRELWEYAKRESFSIISAVLGSSGVLSAAVAG
jgi:predicted nuclease of predicted toxin-antitoxin system